MSVIIVLFIMMLFLTASLFLVYKIVISLFKYKDIRGLEYMLVEAQGALVTYKEKLQEKFEENFALKEELKEARNQAAN